MGSHWRKRVVGGSREKIERERERGRELGGGCGYSGSSRLELEKSVKKEEGRGGRRVQFIELELTRPTRPIWLELNSGGTSR